jgi:hypothetical protein
MSCSDVSAARGGFIAQVAKALGAHSTVFGRGSSTPSPTRASSGAYHHSPHQNCHFTAASARRRRFSSRRARIVSCWRARITCTWSLPSSGAAAAALEERKAVARPRPLQSPLEPPPSPRRALLLPRPPPSSASPSPPSPPPPTPPTSSSSAAGRRGPPGACIPGCPSPFIRLCVGCVGWFGPSVGREKTTPRRKRKNTKDRVSKTTNRFRRDP